MKPKISACILKAIDQVNLTLDADRLLGKEPGAVVFGSHSPLDSLGAINLISAVERELERETAHSVSLLDILFQGDDAGRDVTVADLEILVQSVLE